MVCDDVRPVTSFPLPDACSLRWFQPGEEAFWIDVQRRADRYNEFSPSTFASTYRSAPDELTQRLCFLCGPEGAPLGTATAWFGEAPPWVGFGRVHWVAVIPEQQGRGWSKPLLSEVCRQLLRLHGPRAYLTTATCRVPALNLYSRFGFRPRIADASERLAWGSLLSGDSATQLLPQLREDIEGRA